MPRRPTPTGRCSRRAATRNSRDEGGVGELAVLRPVTEAGLDRGPGRILKSWGHARVAGNVVLAEPDDSDEAPALAAVEPGRRNGPADGAGHRFADPLVDRADGADAVVRVPGLQSADAAQGIRRPQEFLFPADGPWASHRSPQHGSAGRAAAGADAHPRL